MGDMTKANKADVKYGVSLLALLMTALFLVGQPVRAESTFVLQNSKTGYVPLSPALISPFLLTDKGFWEKLEINPETSKIIKSEMTKLEGRQIAGEWGTPLHYAVAFGPAEAIPIMIATGADVNQQLHYDKKMPWYRNLFEVETKGILHTAVLLEGTETQIAEKVEALIEAGADENASGLDGYTPLHNIVFIQHDHPPQRASVGMIKAMNKLVEAGANINATNKDGNTPLHLAFKHGNIDVVNFLLDAGADQSALNADGLTPFDMVFERYSANPLFTDGFYNRNFFKFSKTLKKIRAADINN